MPILNENILLFQIEKKRKEMIHLAAKTGLTSCQTVTKSKELDDLLNLHQFIINIEKAREGYRS